MILICPSCSAKFMISSEALGMDGREVRCGKCGHMWFQPPEHDSLDELSRFAEAEEAAAQTENDVTVDFTQPGDNPFGGSGADTPFSTTDDAKPASFDHDKNNGQWARHAAAIFSALAIVAIIVLALFALRGPLSATFMGNAFAALGFQSNNPDIPSLAFDRLKLVNEKSTLSGSGYLINLSEEEIRLDNLKADLLDSSKNILSTVDVKLKEKTIEAESSQEIQFSFEKIPEKAESVRVHISD